MPAKLSSWPCRRSRRYYVRMGEPDLRGKRKPVMLRDEHGKPIVLGDEAGRHRAMARLIEERDAAEAACTSGPTVAALCVAFLKWHQEHGTKKRTIEGHHYHLSRFGEFEHLGEQYQDMPATAIGVAELTRYRKHMQSRGNQTGYLRLAYASILACWRWAARPVEDRKPLRMIETNPFEGLARPKRGRGRRLVLPWPVIQDLLLFAYSWTERTSADRNQRVALERYRDVSRRRVIALHLMAECGTRPHEALELRWDWLHEDERVIVIPPEHTKTQKEDRIIGLSPTMAQGLAELRQGESHPIFVFAAPDDPRQSDSPPQVHQFDKWFRSLRVAAQAAGLAIPDAATPYTLRHSFVSQARAGGIDLRELAPAMGHSAQVSESTYAHAQLGEIRELMDRARAAREGSAGG